MNSVLQTGEAVDQKRPAGFLERCRCRGLLPGRRGGRRCHPAAVSRHCERRLSEQHDGQGQDTPQSAGPGPLRRTDHRGYRGGGQLHDAPAPSR